MGSTWSYLDITALGRQEEWEDSPEGYPQTPPYQWWNLHDEYGPSDPDRARGGLPLEELLPSPDGAAAACWRAPGLVLRLRRRREPA